MRKTAMYVCLPVSRRNPLTPNYLERWMTCNFTSFSTVFQLYQDNGRMVIKGIKLRSARSASQNLTHRAFGASVIE